ncbi:MAG TPA: universal stress protein [Opitutaceae bacterium]
MPAILCCTDGSGYARSVYDHSVWAARRTGAALHILHMLEHVEQLANADVNSAVGIDVNSAWLNEMVALDEAHAQVAQARSHAILEEARQHLDAAGITGAGVEQQHGALADSIERFEAPGDLVVIGKRGEHADFGRRHLGSNLERVIRHCRCPVLVAPRAFQPIERVLIAFDGGPSAKKAIAHAREQPLLRGLPLHLLSAGSPRPAAAAELEAARIQLVNAGYSVTAETLPGSPETVIAGAVRRLNAGLLVIGAYRHSRLRHLIAGSTTTALLRSERLPLLVFR